MKQAKQIFLLIIIGLMTIYSCEKIIDVSLPERDKKIVLNSAITPDSLITVNLSKSLGVFDGGQTEYINNASVKLYSEGIEIEELSLQSNWGQYYSNIYHPDLEEQYEIRVEVPGMTSVKAECSIPLPVEIISWDTISHINSWGEETIKASIKFDDPADFHNYYWFRGITIETFIETDSIGNIIFDDNGNPVLAEYEGSFWIDIDQMNSGIDDGSDYLGGLFFSDRIINGNSFDLKFEFYPYWREKFYRNVLRVKLIIELHSVTKDFFLYASSYSRHINTQGITFLEPSQVYNNISKGFGIFAGYSSSRDSITLLDLIN